MVHGSWVHWHGNVAVIVGECKVLVVGQFGFGGPEALADLVHVPFLGCRDDGDESPDAFSHKTWPAFEVALLDCLYPCADDGGEQAGMIECDKLVCVFAFVEAVGLHNNGVVGIVMVHTLLWDGWWVCLWCGLLVINFDLPLPVCSVSPSAQHRFTSVCDFTAMGVEEHFAACITQRGD